MEVYAWWKCLVKHLSICYSLYLLEYENTYHNFHLKKLLKLSTKIKKWLLTFYAKINVFKNFFFQKTKCASNRSNLPVDMLEMVEWQNDTSLKINHWKEGCSIDLWTKCILIGGNQVKFTVSKLGPDCLCACYGK